MVAEISVQTNLKEFEKGLTTFSYRQLPFATSVALNSIAGVVQREEKAALHSVFDRPTPFTVNSVAVKPARKDNLQAMVYVKDIASAYLQPYEFGGTNKLNSRALLKPVGATLNQYGNLSKSKLAQLKAKGNTFVGAVKGKNGEEIRGVWQRTPAAKGKPASMKLLIRFADAHKATQHWDYRTRAEQIVQGSFNFEMSAAFAKAMATAR